LQVEGNIQISNGNYFTRGSYVVSATIAHDDTYPKTLYTVDDGYVITNIYVETTEVFDGAALISVGDVNNDDGLMNSFDIALTILGYSGYQHSQIGTYLSDGSARRNKIYTTSTAIRAYKASGSPTQGEATVYLEITKLK